MGKHTPGPWGATTRRDSWDWVVYREDDRNHEICQMFHDGTELNETGEANAHLIAAAPDMLEALQAIIAAKEEGFPEALQMGRNAIAKAEGRS